MMEEVGAHPHNLANCSPVAHGDLIYVSTSNGQDESHVNVPSPKAPSIIAVNKKTGKLVWEDNSSSRRSCTASGRRRRSARSAASSRS